MSYSYFYVILDALSQEKHIIRKFHWDWLRFCLFYIRFCSLKVQNLVITIDLVNRLTSVYSSVHSRGIFTKNNERKKYKSNVNSLLQYFRNPGLPRAKTIQERLNSVKKRQFWNCCAFFSQCWWLKKRGKFKFSIFLTELSRSYVVLSLVPTFQTVLSALDTKGDVFAKLTRKLVLRKMGCFWKFNAFSGHLFFQRNGLKQTNVKSLWVRLC